MTKDMTNGSPFGLILRFTVPLMFGNLFQQFYSMVDTIIVGKFLGKEALAAVGSTGSINFLIIGFCLGLCSGFAIPVSQQFGAKNFEALRRYVGNIIWLTIGASVVFTVLTVALCRPMLEWMNTPSDIIDGAYWYIVVIFAGIPAIFLYNIQAALLRALGDSRTPVIFLVIASFLNIGFDLLLVLVIPMGVVGAAVATVLAQLLSGVACFVFIVKKFPALHLSDQKTCDWKRNTCQTLLHRRPYGAAIFYYSHWQHYSANLGKCIGLCHCGGCYCRRTVCIPCWPAPLTPWQLPCRLMAARISAPGKLSA